MKFTRLIAFASFLAKATFSVLLWPLALHLDKSCKMVNDFTTLVSCVNIILLT